LAKKFVLEPGYVFRALAVPLFRILLPRAELKVLAIFEHYCYRFVLLVVSEYENCVDLQATVGQTKSDGVCRNGITAEACFGTWATLGWDTYVSRDLNPPK